MLGPPSVLRYDVQFMITILLSGYRFYNCKCALKAGARLLEGKHFQRKIAASFGTGVARVFLHPTLKFDIIYKRPIPASFVRSRSPRSNNPKSPIADSELQPYGSWPPHEDLCYPTAIGSMSDRAYPVPFQFALLP
ncbi:hypothetical protein EVAR_38272_1 [Eumeta japonica]|uniref:Uncharacterized protein n=1 Tax=Eumeta variegata TaxID=151549 RepID=A0A4C1W7W0_EUMVA|nr:hypothetical protein EVAR_38272_1 [Eumeta japonica]